MTSKRVEIISETDVFKRYFFRIVEAQMRYEKFDGKMSGKITRLSLERGDGVAAVLYNPVDDTVILIEQFRYPAYHKSTGWMLELPAGIVEDSESPEATMRRELDEEIGYQIKDLRPILTTFVSPGGSSERIHLFYASVQSQDKTNAGGGLAHEGEDIRVVILKRGEVASKIASGEIVDAKTIIGLLWLQLNHPIR